MILNIPDTQKLWHDLAVTAVLHLHYVVLSQHTPALLVQLYILVRFFDLEDINES